jgi:hypothetical protein
VHWLYQKAGLSRFGSAGCLTELWIVHQGVAHYKMQAHGHIAQPLDGTRPAKEFRQGQNAITRPRTDYVQTSQADNSSTNIIY